MEWLGLALLGIGSIAGIIAFVCAVIVAVKMLQNNQTALGVITIIGFFFCGIGYLLALIFGWQNRQAWGLQKVMPILTASLILSFVLFVPGYVMIVAKAVQEGEFDMSEFGTTEDMSRPEFVP